MGAWPLSMVATKWLDNVNALFVCIYVYALSTLTYSLNIFRKKKCSKREVGSYVSRVGLSWPKKKNWQSHGLEACFLFGPKNSISAEWKQVDSGQVNKFRPILPYLSWCTGILCENWSV